MIGWIEAIQGYLDQQPQPDKVDGLIPCDRRVFEDDAFFCVVAREPLAEGHVRLICKYHLTDLGQLRGITSDDVDNIPLDTVRSSLLDDLIIAHDVVRGYDRRVTTRPSCRAPPPACTCTPTSYRSTGSTTGRSTP